MVSGNGDPCSRAARINATQLHDGLRRNDYSKQAGSRPNEDADILRSCADITTVGRLFVCEGETKWLTGIQNSC